MHLQLVQNKCQPQGQGSSPPPCCCLAVCPDKGPGVGLGMEQPLRASCPHSELIMILVIFCGRVALCLLLTFVLGPRPAAAASACVSVIARVGIVGRRWPRRRRLLFVVQPCKGLLQPPHPAGDLLRAESGVLMVCPLALLLLLPSQPLAKVLHLRSTRRVGRG